jgi:hypothetical protein
MPPVMREVCACLSEILVISHLIAAEPDQWPAGPALIDARTAQNLDRPVQALFKALEDALAPYCYSWNYPLARILALRGAAKLSQLQLWQIFRGEISLVALIRTLGD